MLNILIGLCNKLGLLMMVAFLLSKTKILRRLITKQIITKGEIFILIITFGTLGALGSYFSIPFNGALVNTRIIGVAAGGLLGGPFVGFGAGLIAGLHRYIIDIGGFTTLACSISTVIEGTMAGFVYYLVQKKERKWVYGLTVGASAELFRKIMVLLLARPWEDAVTLVKFITLPMVIANSIGLALFIAMIENAFIEQERASAHQAKLSLKIATKTLPILRKGMNNITAKKAAEIIYNETDLAAVRITDKAKILAHIGWGSNFYKSGTKIMTELTKNVIKTDKYAIGHYKETINCSKYPYCLLQSVVIVPLKERDKVLGTLMLFKRRKEKISNVDIELALGLAHLISTQLELSKLEEQSKLLTKAELRSLQSQINPHFLFNVLNTISILCRIDPEKAREVTINLADYYRKNLRKNDDLIELSKEIEHVKSYLAIEKIRFNKKLTINYEIEKVECLVPPLIIQPIVENAVKHGILPNNKGTITIQVIDNKNFIEVNIIDDGIGMSREKLLEIFNSDINSSGIGIFNVDQRLKHLYGEEFGLQINSKPDKGTEVKLRFPKVYIRKDEIYA